MKTILENLFKNSKYWPERKGVFSKDS